MILQDLGGRNGNCAHLDLELRLGQVHRARPVGPGIHELDGRGHVLGLLLRVHRAEGVHGANGDNHQEQRYPPPLPTGLDCLDKRHPIVRSIPARLVVRRGVHGSETDALTRQKSANAAARSTAPPPSTGRTGRRSAGGRPNPYVPGLSRSPRWPSASRNGSPGGTRSPVIPSSMISPTPPTSVATTGDPKGPPRLPHGADPLCHSAARHVRSHQGDLGIRCLAQEVHAARRSRAGHGLQPGPLGPVADNRQVQVGEPGRRLDCHVHPLLGAQGAQAQRDGGIGIEAERHPAPLGGPVIGR